MLDAGMTIHIFLSFSWHCNVVFLITHDAIGKKNMYMFMSDSQ